MLKCQSHCFNIPEDVSYLNCSYMGPISHRVFEAGNEAMIRKTQPYRITVEDFFQPVEDLKMAFAGLINARESRRVAVIPSVSYGMATIAKNLRVRPGQNIVTLKEQFPSNVYCWQRLCQENSLEMRTIDPPAQAPERGREWNNRILEAIDEKTAAVTIGTVHWADGTRFDLQALRKRTREVGAQLIVDGTQSIGAMPFDITLIQPDAVVCAAYKWLLGPYAISMAYYGPAFDDGVPLEENWINRLGSDNFRSQVGYIDSYHPYAARYDMGEKSNFFLVPMVNTSLAQIKSWGVSNIQSYCESITAPTVKKLQDLGFIIEDPPLRAHNIFGIRFPQGYRLEPVQQTLKEAKVHVSLRGDAIRVSPHVYNTPDHLEKLVSCLITGLP